MKRKFRLPIVIGITIVFIFMVLAVSSFALAQAGTRQSAVLGAGISNPQGVLAPVPGGPGFISLNSHAFEPYYPNELYDRFGQLLYCSQQTECQFHAGINLPHGATITKLVAYYYDNSSDEIHVALLRGPLIAEFPEMVAEIITEGTGTTDRYSETTTILNPIIDNQSYSYFVVAEFPDSGHQLHFINVRVDYSYQSLLPLTQK